QGLFGVGAGVVGVAGTQVYQHQVVVGAAGLQAVAVFQQRVRQGLGVPDDLLGVPLELRPQRLAEGDRLGGDDVHQRAALAAGEDTAVDRLGEGLVVGQDQAAARAAEG